MWWMIVTSILLFVLFQMRESKTTSSIQLPLEEWMPTSSVPVVIRALSIFFYISSLLFLSWAFIHWAVGSGPIEHYFIPSSLSVPSPSPSRSRVLFFVVDRSGSMAEPMTDSPQYSKMQSVKQGLDTCVSLIDEHGGENDFIGLETFARAAKTEVPFSRDRGFLREMINRIVPETVERLNGTSIGYAIFKSVALIAACRSFATKDETKPESASLVSNTLVLITDGLEEPNPADRAHPYRSIRTLQALSYAKDNHVKVNYVNIDKHSYQKLSQAERDRLLDAVEATGGKYFEVTVGQSLGQVMSQIASSIQRQYTPPPPENRAELGFWLIVIGLTCASVSGLLETAGVRVVR
jgi:Ca-activated chloride channel family protein